MKSAASEDSEPVYAVSRKARKRGEEHPSCHGAIGPVGTLRDPTFFICAIFNQTVGLRLCLCDD